MRPNGLALLGSRGNLKTFPGRKRSHVIDRSTEKHASNRSELVTDHIGGLAAPTYQMVDQKLIQTNSERVIII